MPDKQDAERIRAERIFKLREQQKADGSKATAEYYAALQAVRDRTQELRRLRLAREAQKKARSLMPLGKRSSRSRAQTNP